MNILIKNGIKRGSYKRDAHILNRNLRIKEDFRNMKKNGIKNKDAYAALSNKYFLSEGSINSIIYLKKNYAL